MRSSANDLTHACLFLLVGMGTPPSAFATQWLSRSVTFALAQAMTLCHGSVTRSASNWWHPCLAIRSVHLVPPATVLRLAPGPMNMRPTLARVRRKRRRQDDLPAHQHGGLFLDLAARTLGLAQRRRYAASQAGSPGTEICLSQNIHRWQCLDLYQNVRPHSFHAAVQLMSEERR